jgi:hypothetical protein
MPVHRRLLGFALAALISLGVAASAGAALGPLADSPPVAGAYAGGNDPGSSPEAGWYLRAWSWFEALFGADNGNIVPRP